MSDTDDTDCKPPGWSEERVSMYGPRAKLLANESRTEYRLILDEFVDNEDGTCVSKVVEVHGPIEQIREWHEAFGKLLAAPAPAREGRS